MPTARRITLREAVDLALARNHAVRLAQLSVDEKDRAKEVTRSAYFPQVRNDTTLVHLTDTQLIEIPAGAFGALGSTLQQVILNLLRNASDAMVDVHDRPRELLIRTEREDANRVRLTIRDAGAGLLPQSLDSLFDAFYTTKSGGMGIGLFVSRSIIERHHGRLWAEPNEGAPGASFSFSIPRDGEVGANTVPATSAL
jgi:signal transduction histidine kinase